MSRDECRVSLVDASVPHDPEGLCSARFRADYRTTHIDYETLRPGDLVRCGGRLLRITQVGKRCHPGCALTQAGRRCALKSRCAFAEPAPGEAR